MGKCLILILFIAFSNLLKGAVPAEVIFRSGDFGALKAEAAREGKLLLVHFTASWCTPCRWMENNTFTDRGLADFVNLNFFPVKVDIEEREGADVKEEYGIKVLPSLLIFDTLGQVIARYEESMSAPRLEILLRRHYLAIMGIPAPSASASPRQDDGPGTNKPALSAAAVPGPSVSSPETKQRTALPLATQASRASGPEKKAEVSAPPPAPVAPKPPARVTPPAAEPPAGTTAASRFCIQLGVFGSYENASRQLEYFKSRIAQPLRIYPGVHAGKSVYRIMLGEFASREEAEELARELKDQEVPVLVKDLSEL